MSMPSPGLGANFRGPQAHPASGRTERREGAWIVTEIEDGASLFFGLLGER